MERNCWITVSTRDTNQSTDDPGDSCCSFAAAVGIAVAFCRRAFFSAILARESRTWRVPIGAESAGLLKFVATFAAIFLGFLSMGLFGADASLSSLDVNVFHDVRLVATREKRVNTRLFRLRRKTILSQSNGKTALWI